MQSEESLFLEKKEELSKQAVAKKLKVPEGRFINIIQGKLPKFFSTSMLLLKFSMTKAKFDETRKSTLVFSCISHFV